MPRDAQHRRDPACEWRIILHQQYPGHRTLHQLDRPGLQADCPSRKKRRRVLLKYRAPVLAILSAALLLAGCHRSSTEVPRGYPAAYADLIDAAKREGALLIWSAIDAKKAAPLIADFRSRYPFLRVHYIELRAGEVYSRTVENAAHHTPTADFLWSSAMDLQIKLANDGFATSYVSPERRNIPDWANWKNQAWGTTAEPVVLLYNRDLIADAAMPRDHIALTKLLEQRPKPLSGKIATYDLPRSAVGYLYLSQDQQATHDIWRLVTAMGDNKVRLFPNAEEIAEDVVHGRSAIGYNIVGSFALDEIRRHPQLGMVLPRDYTLLMSRLAVIPVTASHPAAAKLFLDFLLSARGQRFLATVQMPSVRQDVANPAELSPRDVRLRAIRVGPGLLVHQDQLTRQYMLKRWQKALSSDPGSSPDGS